MQKAVMDRNMRRVKHRQQPGDIDRPEIIGNIGFIHEQAAGAAAAPHGIDRIPDRKAAAKGIEVAGEQAVVIAQLVRQKFEHVVFFARIGIDRALFADLGFVHQALFRQGEAAADKDLFDCGAIFLCLDEAAQIGRLPFPQRPLLQLVPIKVCPARRVG